MLFGSRMLSVCSGGVNAVVEERRAATTADTSAGSMPPTSATTTVSQQEEQHVADQVEAALQGHQHERERGRQRHGQDEAGRRAPPTEGRSGRPSRERLLTVLGSAAHATSLPLGTESAAAQPTSIASRSRSRSENCQQPGRVLREPGEQRPRRDADPGRPGQAQPIFPAAAAPATTTKARDVVRPAAPVTSSATTRRRCARPNRTPGSATMAGAVVLMVPCKRAITPTEGLLTHL